MKNLCSRILNTREFAIRVLVSLARSRIFVWAIPYCGANTNRRLRIACAERTDYIIYYCYV